MAKINPLIEFVCDEYGGKVTVNRDYIKVSRGFETVDHIKLKRWTCTGMDSCGFAHENCPNKDKFK